MTMTMTMLTCSLVKKALVCPHGQSASAVGFLVDEEHTLSANTMKQCVPLRSRAACRLKYSGLASVLCRRCVSVRMIVMRNIGYCFLDECACGGCLGVAEAQLHFIERKSSVSSSSSSSLVPASFWSSALVVIFVLSCVVRWVVVVVVMFVGREGFLSLLLVKSFATTSHFELFSAVVSLVGRS